MTGTADTMTDRAESPDARLKRLGMRSWRRGTKEMDLILGPYSDARLAAMAEADLVTYDKLLWENDQDLLPWVLGQNTAPEAYSALVADIGRFARTRLAR